MTDETVLGKKPVNDKLDSFIGFQGQFSAFAKRDRQKASKFQRSQQAIALETSVRDNTKVMSPVSDVSSSSGSRLTRVPQCFKPT